MALNKLFANLSIQSLLCRRTLHVSAVQCASKPNLVKPKPGYGKSYRRIVHFPEEYTVKPLEVTNLAGRDPVSGRIVAKGIGGGIKHKYHWIAWKRDGPSEGPPLEEKVIQALTPEMNGTQLYVQLSPSKVLHFQLLNQWDLKVPDCDVQILEDGCRTANIALVATGDKLKYILATENMKAGDILKTSRELPRNPVRANEGDAYLLGALPAGTIVHNIEKVPDGGAVYIHAAGTYGTILRKQDDRVIVQMPSKMQFSFEQRCMAVVGRLSNIEHGNTPIGSAQRNRWLGNRPRSGLWHRKDGRHGRKIKPPKPVKVITAAKNNKMPPNSNIAPPLRMVP